MSRCWRAGLLVASAVVLVAPAAAESPTASIEAVRGGVTLRVLVHVDGRALRVQVWAWPSDGVAHQLAADPIDLRGLVECVRGDGSGHGWSEGHGGSDGWSTSIALQPGAERLVYDHRVRQQVAPFHRGCKAELELRLPLIDGLDVEDSTAALAKVQWARPARGADAVSLRAPDGATRP